MVSLWLRIGDGGDYEAHGDDLDSVATALAEYMVAPPLYWRQGGFETDAFTGHDYISLYYGDRQGNFAHDLDASERRLIEQKLVNLASEYSGSKA